MRKWCSVLFLLGCLTGCSSEVNYAPVTDIATIEHIPKNGTYRVSQGETLYSIAWRYGLDYRYLASINHIAPPFHVVAGQHLYLSPKPLKSIPQKNRLVPKIPRVPTLSVSRYTLEPDFNKRVTTWRWPAHGPVIGVYSTLNKGINIGGQKGNPVYSTAGGQVVYSGNGLRGYGNLIIIKHNSTYLSAYAHNSVVLVKEGQLVNAGQEIAEMGGKVGLHFEIRRNGQPVNPLNYLNYH